MSQAVVTRLYFGTRTSSRVYLGVSEHRLESGEKEQPLSGGEGNTVGLSLLEISY